jgi:hypothetical protein
MTLAPPNEAYTVPERRANRKWNLADLRAAVEGLYGAPQRAQVQQCLESLIDRQFFARMQYQAAMKMLEEFFATQPANDEAMVNLAFGLDHNVHGEFVATNKRAEGHIVACIESMHAISDTFGHVLYFALGLDRSPALTPHRVNLYRVARELSKSEDCSRLCRYLAKLTGSSGYDHLAAATNHCKHRSLVGVPYTFFTNNDPHHGLHLRAFTYGRNQAEVREYPSVAVDRFLQREYRRQSVLSIATGRELNRVVQARLDKKLAMEAARTAVLPRG